MATTSNARRGKATTNRVAGLAPNPGGQQHARPPLITDDGELLIADATQSDVEQTMYHTFRVDTKSRIWYLKWDSVAGEYKHKSIQGDGRKFVLEHADLLYNLSLPLPEHHDKDPFRNGMLTHLSGQTEGLPAVETLTTEQLLALIAGDEKTLRRAVEDLTSEVQVRRIYAIAQERENGMAVRVIKEQLDERWPVGRTASSMQEILEQEERESRSRSRSVR